MSIHSVTSRSTDVDEALRGVFRLGDERFELAPPVDWSDTPYRAAGERGFFQNSLVFADPLLKDPRAIEVLAPLAELFADWARANPRRDAARPHRYAWHDHAAAGRLVYMAYVLREGVRCDVLEPALRQELSATVIAHAEYLLAPENYSAGHNHGLFSDAALALAARSLSVTPFAPAWADVAERRFEAILTRSIDREDALHLEHSPVYHWIIHGALTRFASVDLFPGLADLVERMRESGAWLVAPDGTLPPLGDTPPARAAPGAAVRLAAGLSGTRAFGRAGYAVVREGGSYLIVTAAHHPTGHKHADDGSFCLWETGRPVITDAGDAGYDYASPERRFCVSPRAHSGVSVDEHDWVAERAQPHGSGVLAARDIAGGALTAILTGNPAAVQGGGGARRLLLYAPGRFLAAVDAVEAGPEQLVTRRLQLAPELSATVAEDGSVRLGFEDGASAVLVAFASIGAVPEGVALERGCRTPEMAGFTFPAPGQSRPTTTVRLTAPGGPARAFVLHLGDEVVAPTLRVDVAPDVLAVEILGIPALSGRILARRGEIELVR